LQKFNWLMRLQPNDGVADTAQQSAANYNCYPAGSTLPNSCPSKPATQGPDPVNKYALNFYEIKLLAVMSAAVDLGNFASHDAVCCRLDFALTSSVCCFCSYMGYSTYCISILHML